MEAGGQRHTPAVLRPGKRVGTHCTGGWVGPRPILDGCGKYRPKGIRSPDRPARRESLYRLSYRGPPFTTFTAGISRDFTISSFSYRL